MDQKTNSDHRTVYAVISLNKKSKTRRSLINSLKRMFFIHKPQLGALAEPDFVSSVTPSRDKGRISISH